MNTFQGETLSWQLLDGTIELTLDRAPCNEIGRATLADLEKFVAALALTPTRSPRANNLQRPHRRLLRRSRSCAKRIA